MTDTNGSGFLILKFYLYTAFSLVEIYSNKHMNYSVFIQGQHTLKISISWRGNDGIYILTRLNYKFIYSVNDGKKF